MIHDEKTTEIELPKVVRVKFTEKRKEPVRKAVSAAIPKPQSTETVLRWIKDVDLESPWMIRLFALVAILILSMLVL